MNSAVRTLPIRMAPGEGESFASYMNRFANDINAPLAALMKATGLADKESFASLPAAYGITLSRDKTTEFSRVTGLSEAEVSALLLTAYDGTVCDFSGLDPKNPTSLPKIAFKEWAYFSNSHVCPDCLKESNGVWKLAWKLPWSFACVRHERLLVDTCPSCERPIGRGRHDGRSAPSFPSLVPDPLACRNTLPAGQASEGRSSQPCGHPLADLPMKSLKRHRRLLEVQKRLDRAMAGDKEATTVGGVSMASREYFHDLRSLCAFLLLYGTTEDLGELPRVACERFERRVEERERIQGERVNLREAGESWLKGPRWRPYAGVPNSVALMTSIAPFAVELFVSGSTAQMAAKLEPLVERLRREIGKPRSRFQYLGFSESMMDVFELCLAPYMKTVNRLGMATNGRGGSQEREFPLLTANHVPQLFWWKEFEQSFAELLPGIRQNNARRLCSMWLVKLIQRCTWKEAAGSLELPPDTACGIANKAMALLNREGNAGLFAERLRWVARRLEGDPNRVDYGSRRRALLNFTEIPAEEWQAICKDADVLEGKAGGKSRYAAAWVWCELTGGDYILAPAVQKVNRKIKGDGYRRFLKQHLRKLEARLLEYSEELLAECEVT